MFHLLLEVFLRDTSTCLGRTLKELSPTTISPLQEKQQQVITANSTRVSYKIIVWEGEIFFKDGKPKLNHALMLNNFIHMKSATCMPLAVEYFFKTWRLSPPPPLSL